MLTPRENLKLFGHQEALDLFLKAFHSPRFSHGWILGGDFGIGKATFAFHLARYILSGRQNRNTDFSQEDPLYCRIKAQSHGDLWTVGGDETEEIGVDSIRGLNECLNQTAAEGGWRVVIIDGADKLNRNGANALLKRLEEPPLKTVFFLTADTPGRLLPTIRSRCQLLALKPLKDEEVKETLHSQGLALPDFFSIGQGSPGRLMRLMEGDGPQVYRDLYKVLDGESAASFIQSYGGGDASYELIKDFLKTFLYGNIKAKIEEKSSYFMNVSLGQALMVYEKVEELFNQCQYAQLDKKATLGCVFAYLQDRNLK